MKYVPSEVQQGAVRVNMILGCVNIHVNEPQTKVRRTYSIADECTSKLEPEMVHWVAMVVQRHLTGSDPSIEVTDRELGGDSALTVHFKERRPKAALEIAQEARSVVIHDVASGTVAGDPAEVTQVTRTKREGHGWTAGVWLVWVETHWIVIVIAIALLTLLVVAVHLRR